MTLHIEKPPAAATPSPPPFRERRGLPAAAPIRLAHIVSVSGSHAVAVLERQDESLIEAAQDLGATPLSAFWRVTFPLSIPGAAAGAVRGRRSTSCCNTRSR